MKHTIYTTILCFLAVVIGQAAPQSNGPCAALAVRLTTPSVQAHPLYGVAYCNQGDETATNSYIDIEINDPLTIQKATVPLVERSGNIYRFFIGDIGPGVCGSLFFEVPHSSQQLPCLNIYAVHENNCADQQATTGSFSMNDGCTDAGGIGGNTNDDSDNVITGNNATGVRTVVGGGSGFIDPIFEDHVFLDVVPTWDSLLNILGQSMGYDLVNFNGGASEPDQSISTVDYTSIPAYAMDEDCSGQANTSLPSRNFTNVNQIKAETEVPLWRWTNQPMVQQSTLILTEQVRRETQLTLVDATGRQVALLTTNNNTLVVDRTVLRLDQGVYYYLLERDGKQLGSGVLMVQ